MDSLVKRLRDPHTGTLEDRQKAADEIETLRNDAADAWDLCEEYRQSIARLEAQVAAADALAEFFSYPIRDGGIWEYVEDDAEAALAAYNEAKKGGA